MLPSHDSKKVQACTLRQLVLDRVHDFGDEGSCAISRDLGRPDGDGLAMQGYLTLFISLDIRRIDGVREGLVSTLRAGEKSIVNPRLKSLPRQIPLTSLSSPSRIAI